MKGRDWCLVAVNTMFHSRVLPSLITDKCFAACNLNPAG